MTAIFTKPQERTRFMRFAVVGIIGAMVDFGVANILVHYFHISLVVGGTVSFICAILSNFTWNRVWTYPDSRSKPVARQLMEFSLVSLAGLLIRVPILAYVEPIALQLFDHLPNVFLHLSDEVLATNFTLAIAVIIVMFWNFFANRYWTYSDIE
jgi:putative flippase GtrA